MACIMCSGKLLRQLGYSGRQRSSVPEHFMPGVALGSWAAKVFTDQGRDLVIALDTRTYLTLVFAYAPGAQFHSNFATALANGLHDVGVPPAIVRIESTAVEFAPLVPLRNRQLTDALNHVWSFCDIEFCYHQDLRTIQRNLNDLPHPNRDPCVPLEAIRRLFRESTATSCLN
jgi:hypothetical protein